MFLLLQWLLERATTLGYPYIACLLTVQIQVSADIGYAIIYIQQRQSFGTHLMAFL
jgi:hypothetical protein